jgi:hypothetical protein
VFLEAWKEAIITPILKKGDPTKKEIYRPVSCLSVASKVQTWQSGKKLNQVQLAFCWQMSKHWNSSLEETMSTSWLLVHSPETKHWRSMQLPGVSIFENMVLINIKILTLKLKLIKYNIFFNLVLICLVYINMD